MIQYRSGIHRSENLEIEVGLALLSSTSNDPLVEFVLLVSTTLDYARVE